MTSVEIFAVLFFGIAGYLVVSHFLNRSVKRPPSGSTSDSSKSESHTDEGGPQEGTQSKSVGQVPRHWWEVLGISSNASAEDIRQAYRSQVGKYHPDKVSHLGDEFRVIAETRAKEINGAYLDAMRARGAAD